MNDLLDQKLISDLESLAKVGRWELDCSTGETTWSDGVYHIHKLSPDTPTNKVNGISFYAPHERERISSLVEKCIEDGVPFDEEFEFFDAQDNKLWVRAIGRLRSPVEGESKKLEGVFQDITSYKQKVLALHHKEQLLLAYRKGLDRNTLISFTDSSGVITDVNNQFRDTTGYVREDLIGKTHSILNSGFHTPEFFESMWRTISSGQGWRGEICNRTRSGKIFWLDMTITPLVERSDDIQGFISFSYDITRRKLNEQVTKRVDLLRQRYFYIRTSFDQVLNTSITAIVEEMEMCSGAILLRGKATSKGLYTLGAVFNAKKEILKVGEVHQLLSRDGVNIDLGVIGNGKVLDQDAQLGSLSFNPGRAYIVPLKGGQSEEGLIIVAKDDAQIDDADVVRFRPLFDCVTEMIALSGLEKTLLEKEKDRSFILDKMQIGIWTWLPTKGELLWDESMFGIYGVHHGHFFVSYDSWMELIDPGDRQFMQQRPNQILDQTRDMEFEFRFRIIRPDGEQRHILSKGRIDRDEYGRAIKVYGINRDITEEVRIQDELGRQRSVVAHQAKLASLGKLTAGVGHEVNNPLAIAKGYLQELMRSGEGLSADQRNYLLRIDYAMDRIEKIVKNMRNLSRSDVSDMAKVDLCHIINDTIEMVRDIYKANDISLSVRVPSHGVYIHGNFGRIQQVLLNLLGNARDAQHVGHSMKIRIELTTEEDLAVLCVCDDGPGIPEDVRGKVFEPFFTTKGVHKGTGLGLSIVHTVVSDHSGEISLKSSDEKGACFEIKLPTIRTEEDQPGSRRGNSSDELCLEGLSILIVDDELEVLDILSGFLRETGAVLDCVRTGDEAIEFLKSNVPDVVISDLRMPGIGQVDLLKFYTESLSINTKLIILSGHELDDSIPIHHRDQIFAEFTKPFDVYDLYSALKRIRGK